jgi:DNA-binding HxlR family transcriptional regulator
MSGSLAETFARDRRLVILRLLSEQDGYALSASMLTKAVRQLRHSVYDDTIGAYLVMLEQHGLVQRDEERHASKTITIATLTKLGLDVANGRPHPMVDQPSPKF